MELIRQFEPLTEFLPIKVQDQNTAEIEGQFYVVNILNTLTGVIDPKKTTYWYSEIPLKVFLDRSKIWDRALFRIPELSSSIFVREDLGYLLTQAVPGYFEMIEV